LGKHLESPNKKKPITVLGWEEDEFWLSSDLCHWAEQDVAYLFGGFMRGTKEYPLFGGGHLCTAFRVTLFL